MEPLDRTAREIGGDGEIAIKPITDDYIRNMAGMTGTKGKLLKALMEEKAKESQL